jgi:hypothetical protein
MCARTTKAAGVPGIIPLTPFSTDILLHAGPSLSATIGMCFVQ